MRLSCLNLFMVAVFLAAAMTSSAGTLIDVAFTGASVTSKTGFAATGVTTNDFWNTCSPDVYGLPICGSISPLLFVDGAASDAGLMLGHVDSRSSNGASDPMYGFYLWSSPVELGSPGNIAVTLTDLSAGVYDFYLYGHGKQDNQNSLFQLTVGSLDYGTEATTNGSGWLSSVWQEGVQYVEFTDVFVLAGQTINITVEPNASLYAVLSGLQMVTLILPTVPLILPTNGSPLIINVSNQFVNANEEVFLTNYAYSTNWPISFALASNAPAGATITGDGIFAWFPTCEQGSTTNQITVWVTDSSSPPLSNSMTFTVIVGDCVQVSIGSSVVQAGQSTCVPVKLVASVGLTNLTFTLAYPSGFLTNWNVTPSNSAVSFSSAQTIDPSHTQFNFGVQSGQVLQGTTLLGSICLDTLPGASAFVPLTVVNIGAVGPNNSTATNLIGRTGRIVVIGPQSLLEASLGTNSSRTLTLYGNPGVSYNLLSTTNLADNSSWISMEKITLTDLFQIISLGGPTNQMQFFKAVQL